MVRPRADAVAHRTLLLEAARRVFAEKGIGAEVTDVAAAAGVGVGTFYRNFPRKEDLVLELLSEAAEQDRITFLELEGIADPVEQLRLILRSRLDSVQKYGWLLEAFWSGQMPTRWRDRVKQGEGVQGLRAVLERGVKKGIFSPDLDLDAALGMLSGPPALAALLGQTTRDSAEVADSVLSLFLNGARNREVSA